MSSNNRTTPRLNRSPLTLALATALLFPVGSAYAQSTTQEQAQAEEVKEEASSSEATTLEKVTVTGSRIGKDTFNSVSPVQVITRQETTIAGFNSTASVLQGNSVTGGSEQINNAFGGFVTDGGPGANTLSLRGLGATRTLMLLNGRRVSPSGSRGAVGSADLNVLPNIMIDRIEILKDGASSIYGSDAVAGVVNVITKQKVDGVTVEFQHNATQGGGGDETRWSAMMGTTGDNWRVSGSFEIYNRSEMTLGQRGWASDCPRPLAGRGPDGSYGVDDFIDPVTGEPKCWGLDAGGVTINTLGTAYFLGRPGLGSLGYYGTNIPSFIPPGFDYFNRWRPSAAITDPRQPGFIGPGFEGVDLNGRDTFDPDMKRESLISPTTNLTGFLQGGVDLNSMGDAELYFEVLAHRRESRQNGYLQHTIDYPVGSPLLGNYSWLPAFLGAPSDGSTGGRNVAARAFVGWGMYANWQEVNFVRATTGLRGDLGSEWNYDAYFSHARSDSDYYSNNRLTNRYAKSLDVISDGNGGFVCRDTSDGCIAAPVLTADVIGGNLPRAYRDYIMQTTKGNTLYTESTANVSVNGPLFDLPYGTVGAAFGIEHRRMEIDDTPDANSIANNLYGFTASQPTRGKDSVSEVFGEIEVPLLSGLTGAQELTVNLSGRYTDYDSYGDDTTWKIGMLYTPVSWLSLRASRGTSFRAPALFEQYLGATSGFLGNDIDPCNNWSQRNPASARYVNCQSILPTQPNFQQNNSVTVLTKGGAETGLSAETSRALTAGLVLQPEFPEWFGDLSFAADYYDIQVDNGVARLGGQQVLNLCYDSLAADFTAGNGFCALVTRGVNNALSVTTGYVNVSTDKVRGWDFTLRYLRDIGQGEFRANAQISHYLEQSGRTFPTDPLRDFSGTLNAPEMTGQLDLTYSIKNWTLRYGLEWVDAINGYEFYEKYSNIDYRPDFLMETDHYFLHNVSAQYEGDDWSVTGGVRNLANEEPPIVSNGTGVNRIGNASLYSGFDYIGRSFFLNFTKNF